MSTDTNPPGSRRVGEWISIVSAVVTLLLTGINAYTKAAIDKADSELKQRTTAFEERMRTTAADLEQSKERTSRYGFVNGLLPSVMDSDERKRALTINLIRLSLTPDEADRFFAGFIASTDSATRKTGEEATRIIRQERTASSLAAEKERDGFLALSNGEFDRARVLFSEAEAAFPSYHNVFEISTLLNRNRNSFSDPAGKRNLLRQILRDHEWGIPRDLLPALNAAAGR